LYNLQKHEKRILWAGSSRDAAREFPPDIRRIAGLQLMRLQVGLQPTLHKTVSRVGPGVRETRMRTNTPQRLLYIFVRPDLVFIVHAFNTRTTQYPMRDLLLARERALLMGQPSSCMATADSPTTRRSSESAAASSTAIPSAGNPFLDLGFPRGEAEALAVRAHLLIALDRAALLRCASQAKCAELLGLSRPRLNALLRGRADRVSVDTLIALLTTLDCDVQVTVSPTLGGAQRIRHDTSPPRV
jgi:phage-related protein/predicted XRE-type DNA-binding protein